jgi:hypothetical protein
MNLPLSIQITAVRSLLNVVDIIFNNKDPNSQIGRDLLDRILDTLVNKLGTLRDLVDGARDRADAFWPSMQTKTQMVLRRQVVLTTTLQHPHAVDKDVVQRTQNAGNWCECLGRKKF